MADQMTVPPPEQTLAAWGKCVQAFDNLGPVPQDDSENEILRAKLEIERVRLLAWGIAAGFNTEHASYHLRLLNVRGGIGLRQFDVFLQAFSEPALLEVHYGLRQTQFNGSLKLSHPQSILGGAFKGAYMALPQPHQQTPEGQHGRHSSSASLGHALKRAYTGLKRSSKKEDKRLSAPMRQEATIWVVDDSTRFQRLLSELNMFTRTLMDVYIEYGSSASSILERDIADSQDVRALDLLQRAATGVYDDISQAAGARIQALGTAIPARTKQPASSALGTTRDVPNDRTSQLHQRNKPLDEFIREKRRGILKCDLGGPYGDSPAFVGSLFWEGYEERSQELHDQYRGLVKLPHPAFAPYHRKQFLGNPASRRYIDRNVEDRVLSCPESHPGYEHENPGTTTVEGLGFECAIHSEKSRTHERTVSAMKLPEVGIPSLLRRMDELRRNDRELGVNAELDDADLLEFMGDLQRTYLNPERNRDPARRVCELYTMLNRRDVIADFTTTLSVALATTGYTNKSIGPWNFFRQLILTKELARRLELYPHEFSEEFTPAVLGSLIVADQWFSNMKPTLIDQPLPTASLSEPITADMESRVKSLASQANEAMATQQFQKAADLYAEAIKIDGKNALYRANRSSILQRLNRLEAAYQEAWTATQLDPNYAWGYACLGSARMKLEKLRLAVYAYQRALDVSAYDRRTTSSHKENIERNLKETMERASADEDAWRKETDMTRKNRLHAKIADQDWDLTGKTISFQSMVKDRQVDGLVWFADRLKWPYTSEVRDNAEDAYQKIVTGAQVTQDMHDWLFGLMLPGSYMAFKIMAALISCSPSLCPANELDIAFSSGLSLPKSSYWRVSSSVGRVLAPLTGVISLCGWIGPCPPVEIHTPSSSQAQGFRKRCIDLRAPEVLPIGDNSNKYIQTQSGPFSLTLQFTPSGIKQQENENDEAYASDIRNPSHWTVPQPPQVQDGKCWVQTVRLEAAREDKNKTQQPQNAEYVASVECTIRKPSSRVKTVTYKLETCPTFVTIPPCFPSSSQNEHGTETPVPASSSSHEVHSRELHRYKNTIWDLEQLKNFSESRYQKGKLEGKITVINATTEGAEILARAWCSEKGKSAAIRRRGGACYACAHRATGIEGLGLGVLIWVS